MALMAAIVGFSHLMAGFDNCQLTELVATLKKFSGGSS